MSSNYNILRSTLIANFYLEQMYLTTQLLHKTSKDLRMQYWQTHSSF